MTIATKTIDEELAELEAKRAGNVRNARMLRNGKPDLAIAFEGGSGTQDMICKSLAAGIPVLVVTPTGSIRRLGTDKSAAL